MSLGGLFVNAIYVVLVTLNDKSSVEPTKGKAKKVFR